MIKREYIVNFKNFLVWLLVLVFMFLIVYLIYPYIITDDTKKSMDELMTVFPPEVLKAFNMDMASIETAYGWFKTEGFVFILLIVGLYSAILGSNTLLKEENDKTIEYLISLPIKRNKIITSKIIVSITYVIALVLILGLFNLISFLISGDFEIKQFLLLSVTPIFVGIPLFSMNLFISTFMQKTKKAIGISLGMVFIFYLLSLISEMSSNVEFIKYFSLYTLADVRDVIANETINPINILISVAISAIFIICTYVRYNKKDLI